MNNKTRSKPRAASYRPKPTQVLTDSESKIYDAIVGHLEDAKILHKIDAYSISMAAKTAARVADLEDQIMSGTVDLVQTFESGATNVSGWYTLLLNERKSWDGYCSRFGLTPYHRDKIIGFKAESESGAGIMAKLRDIREKKSAM